MRVQETTAKLLPHSKQHIQKYLMQSYIKYKLSYDGKSKAVGLLFEGDCSFILEVQSNTQSGKASSIFRWFGQFNIMIVVRKNNYAVRRLPSTAIQGDTTQLNYDEEVQVIHSALYTQTWTKGFGRKFE